MLVDSNIRDWVLLPLLGLVLISYHVRMYLISILMSKPVVSALETAQKALIARSTRLRTYGGYISHAGFQMRRRYLIGDSATVKVADGSSGSSKSNAIVGKLKEDVKSPGLANPLMNPGTQMDMIKQQMIGMGTSIGLSYGVGMFFQGFLALKLPFSLTERFKTLTQAGILVPGLDTSFVSSQSWFMTAQLGMPPVLRLFQRMGAEDDQMHQRMMAMQAGMPPGMGPGAGPRQPFQAKQAFTNEAGALEISKWAPLPLLQAEKSLLKEAQSQKWGDTVVGRAAVAGLTAEEKKRQ